MIPEYQIEKNVEIPPEISKSSSRFPLANMEVGDSFEVVKEERGGLQGAQTRTKRKFPDRVYIIRKVSATHYRIWRTK